ncbi:MAG TPA: energy-coupling factor transporter transmembrane component T [Spirochaetia bacterium]|nr:energy-coupling factor transporter transmembrane component T [Spirochaetia bacterium]
MTGLLARFSPVAHLAAVLAWIVPVFLSFDPGTPLLFLALSVAVVFILGQVRVTRFAGFVLPLLVLPFGLFVLNLLFTDTRGHSGSFIVLGLSMNSYALHRAIVLSLRSEALVVISVSYLIVVDPLSLVNGLMQQLGLSPRVGFSIYVAWNTIPRMRTDVTRIRSIHRIRLRGRDRRFADIVPTAVTLLAGAIRHAQRAAISMAVRGLDSGSPRTYLNEARWHSRDTVYLLANLAVTAGLFCLSVGEGWFVFGLG